MIVTTKAELRRYQDVCAVSMEILHSLYQSVAPGVYPIEIERKARELLKKHAARSAFLGVKGEYQPYRFVTCISVNDAIVHGVPSDKIAFQSGDIIKLDFGLVKANYFTDHCVTVVLEPAKTTDLEFVSTSKAAILQGVHAAINGHKAGDIGHAIHTHLQAHGYDVAKEYIGHSIGKCLHERPNIPAYGRPDTGADIRNGMVLCVEAQVVAGSDKWYLERDGWTVRTADHKNSAMFEYMVLVENDTPQILTDTRDWPITK